MFDDGKKSWPNKAYLYFDSLYRILLCLRHLQFFFRIRDSCCGANSYPDNLHFFARPSAIANSLHSNCTFTHGMHVRNVSFHPCTLRMSTLILAWFLDPNWLRNLHCYPWRHEKIDLHTPSAAQIVNYFSWNDRLETYGQKKDLPHRPIGRKRVNSFSRSLALYYKLQRLASIIMFHFHTRIQKTFRCSILTSRLMFKFHTPNSQKRLGYQQGLWLQILTLRRNAFAKGLIHSNSRC